MMDMEQPYCKLLHMFKCLCYVGKVWSHNSIHFDEALLRYL